eukprot:777264_1
MLTQFIGSKPREARVWFAGLEGSGKTSAIFKIKLGKCVQRKTETMSIIQETFEYKKLMIKMWETGNISYNHQTGNDSYTKEMKYIIFKHYYQATEAIVFFIDSANKESILQSKDELQNIAKMKPLNNVPLIVFCNKQDIQSDEVYNVETISEMIDSQNISSHNEHPLIVMGGSVHRGDGIFELLDRIHNAVKKSAKSPSKRVQFHHDVAVKVTEKNSRKNINEDVGNWLERIQKQVNTHDTFMEKIVQYKLE